VARVDRLIGVYDADGSLLGELAYVVGHALGRRACALCDITHGRLRRKAEFEEVAASLPVPLDLLHRDAQSSTLAAATAGRLPCVVAERGGNLTLLVGPDALVGCHGDPTALLDAIRRAAAAHGLELDAA
jgi:hypothetical protein